MPAPLDPYGIAGIRVSGHFVYMCFRSRGTGFHMKRRTQVIYTCQGFARGCSRGGRTAPYNCRRKGRKKRVDRRERLGVPNDCSRSGPTPARTASGSCPASVGHTPRLRIGSLDRLTRTSTQGGVRAPGGLCPHSSPGSVASVPVQGPTWPPDPRLGGVGMPHRTSQRRTTLGRSAVGCVSGALAPPPPRGRRTVDPIGGWCALTPIRTQAWRPWSAARSRPHTGPGPSDRDTWSRLGGSSRRTPNVRPRHRVPASAGPHRP